MGQEVTRRQFVKGTIGTASMFLALPSVAALLAACGESGAGQTTATGSPAKQGANAAGVLIGAIIPLTGSNSGWGQRTWRGLQTATKLINDSGGISALDGKKLTVRVYDTQSQPDVAGNQVQRAIQDGAVVLTGCNQSPASLVASQVAQREHVPFFTASDADDAITGRGFDYVFQADPHFGTYVDSMLQFCHYMGQKTGVGAKRLGILSDNTAIGQVAAKYLKELAPKYELEVVANESFSVSTNNFLPYVAKLKAANAELVFGLQTPEPSVLIVRAMKQLHFDPIGFGGIQGGQVSDEYVKALGPDADYTLCSGAWNSDLRIPNNDKAIAAYEAQWSEKMDVTSAAGFAAGAVIWDSLERAKSVDPKKVRDAMAATDIEAGKDYYVYLTGCRFDDHGYNVKSAIDIMQIKDEHWNSVFPTQYAGKFQPVWPKPKWSA